MAACHRHEAEILLASPGYAAQSSVTRLLEEALNEYRSILAEQDEVEQALSVLGTSRRWLFDMLPALHRVSLQEPEWQATMNAALALHRGLARPAEPSTQTRGHLSDLIEPLRRNLEQLIYPLSNDEVERQLRDARGDAAVASTWRELDALLALPGIAGDKRVGVWEALRDLERHLAEEAERLPIRGNVGPQSSPARKAFPRTPPDPFLRGQRQLQLLQLNDADPQTVASLERSLRGAAKNRNPRLEAGRLLCQTWPTASGRGDDDPQSDLWNWLADWYRYEARERAPMSLAGKFYVRAAQSYHAWLKARDGCVLVSQSPQRTGLSADSPAVVGFTTRVVPSDPAPAAVQIVALKPHGARLEVVPSQWTLEPSELTAGPCTRSTSVRLAADAAAGLVPRCLLLQSRFQGRAYHALLDLPFRPIGPEILIAEGAGSADNSVADVRLRPVRGPQSISIWLRNAGQHAWPRLSVEILAGGRQQAAATLSLAALETRQVRFAPPAAPKVDAPPKPAPDDKAAETPLPEFVAPLVVQVRDLDRPDQPISSRTVPVAVAMPRDYVQFDRAVFQAAGPAGRQSARVEVFLHLRRSLGGTLSTAQLCPPDAAGQSPAVRDGTMQGTLASSGDPLRLYVEKMALGKPDAEGLRFFVRVDDWKRGLVLRAPLAQAGLPASLQLDELPAMRVLLPPWGLAGTAFRVPLEVDNSPPESTVEVSVGRLEGGAFFPEGDTWRGRPWRQRIGCQVPGQAGGVDFTASVEDPLVVLNTIHMRGPREVRARLLDVSGAELVFASRPIVFGDAPPAAPRFIDPPERAWRQAPLRLKASGADPVTQIQAVTFFLGQPIDGKVPAGAAAGPGRPLNDDRTLWEGEVPLPADQKGPASVSVQFVNGLGLSRFVTISVVLEERDPQASKPGRIQGHVLEGTRAQAGLDVVLSGEKGETVGKAKTGDNGEFLFRDVPPGKYRLGCEKSSTQRKGAFPTDPKDFLDVRPGETVTANVVLYIP
jgi:hypothetical protein